MDERPDPYSSPDVVSPSSRAQLIARGRTATMQLASLTTGFGLGVVIFAWANYYGPSYFGWLAIVLTALCYALSIFLVVRIRVLRFRGIATYMFAGVALTTLGLAFIIVTDVAGLAHPGNPFASWNDPAQPQPQSQTVPGPTPGATVTSVALDTLIRGQLKTDETMATGAFRRTHDATGKWPATVTLENGTIIMGDRTTGVSAQDAATLTYTPTPGLTSFVLTLRSADGVGLTYDEATGQFSDVHGTT